MATKRVKIYMHKDQESNFEMVEKLGLSLDSDAGDMASRIGYEVELVYDVDLSTGFAKLVAAEGKYLGDEDVTTGDIDVFA